jgi:hypothetical protein
MRKQEKNEMCHNAQRFSKNWDRTSRVNSYPFHAPVKGVPSGVFIRTRTRHNTIPSNLNFSFKIQPSSEHFRLKFRPYILLPLCAVHLVSALRNSTQRMMMAAVGLIFSVKGRAFG